MRADTQHLPALGVTVMPEWFQHEGVEPVLDRLQAMGVGAIATSPYVMAPCGEGEGAREPPADGEAGKVRPLDRPLWGRRELWVRTAPSLVHETRRYAGLRYQPSPPDPLTMSEGGWLDRLLDAAQARGIAVLLQVMAASPPGYRVQFSNAVADDVCLGPDGRPHPARVDRNASLASEHVVAYVATLLMELAERYPRVAGFRLDWPEYPPYDLRSALFDFNTAACRELERADVDPEATAHAVTAWRGDVSAAAAAAAPTSAQAVRAALVNADWNALFEAGPLQDLFASKRRSVLRLLRACRHALDGVSGSRRRLEAQIFPPPFSRISGFPLEAGTAGLVDVVDAIGVKLYTMHWPMIARYWARDLVGAADDRAVDNVTAALADLFGFSDGLVADGASLRYPEPHQRHPVGTTAQAAKLRAAAAAAPVPVIAFAHTYGPVEDVMQRYTIAGSSGLPVWLNRYGYIGEAKLRAFTEHRASRAKPSVRAAD